MNFNEFKRKFVELCNDDQISLNCDDAKELLEECLENEDSLQESDNNYYLVVDGNHLIAAGSYIHIFYESGVFKFFEWIEPNGKTYWDTHECDEFEDLTFIQSDLSAWIRGLTDTQSKMNSK